jgi:hypothetical protein
MCQICQDGEAQFLADNNSDKVLRRYCGTCEDIRAERFGCALILAEGAQCTDGICGCGGTGIL